MSLLSCRAEAQMQDLGSKPDTCCGSLPRSPFAPGTRSHSQRPQTQVPSVCPQLCACCCAPPDQGRPRRGQWTSGGRLQPRPANPSAKLTETVSFSRYLSLLPLNLVPKPGSWVRVRAARVPCTSGCVSAQALGHIRLF